MESSRAPPCLEPVAGHYFQRMLAQSGAIGREQDMAVSLRQLEGVNEQFLKVFFNMKRLSSGRPREGRRIENDRIKFLPFARESRQHRHHIVRDEAVIDGWQAVQRKILSTPRQRFLGEIDIEGGRSYACRANRKGTGVGKTVQKPLRRDVAHIAPVFSLIDKQAHGIARSEIDPKPEMCLGGDCLQIFIRIDKYETRRYALFVFARDEPGENASKLEPDDACPRL
jgi:hypothetical protein